MYTLFNFHQYIYLKIFQNKYTEIKKVHNKELGQVFIFYVRLDSGNNELIFTFLVKTMFTNVTILKCIFFKILTLIYSQKRQIIYFINFFIHPLF